MNFIIFNNKVDKFRFDILVQAAIYRQFKNTGINSYEKKYSNAYNIVIKLND